MIDRLMNRHGQQTDPGPDAAYSAEKALKAVRLWQPRQGRQSAGLLEVMFSPWHPDYKYHRKEIDRQLGRGTTVLELESHVQAIEPNPARVVDSYKYLSEQAARQVAKLRPDFDRVRLFAASSGNVALSMVAGLQPELFEEATMLAGGNNLAACVWRGKRTVLLRRALEAEGVTYEQLDAAWEPLASSNNVQAFAGKPVTFVRSTRDLNIRPDLQVAYCAELEGAGALLDERVSHWGHYATIGRALIRGVDIVS